MRRTRAVTATVPDTRHEEQSAPPGDGGQQVWSPRGSVALSRMSVERVAERLGDAPNPVLGRSDVELQTAKYLLDGTFDQQGPESRAKISALARLAFEEYAERIGAKSEDLRREFEESRSKT
jgi:hypothetical protein